MPLSRIRENVSVSVRRTDLPFADFLPRPLFLIFFLISVVPGERSIQPRRLLYRVPQTPKSYKKRAQNMRRKEVLLCAWQFEGISQGVPFMDASHKHPESDARVEVP